jgi:hypothetical protein
MSDGTNLVIAGLQLIDYRELEEQLPPDTIRQLPRPARRSGQHGEPMLVTAAVVATDAVVRALSAWLAQRNSQDPEEQGFALTMDPGHKVTISLRASARTGSRDKGEWASQSDIQSALEKALNAG